MDDVVKDVEPPEIGQEIESWSQFLTNTVGDVILSPFNLILGLVIGFLIYKICKARRDAAQELDLLSSPPLPKLKKMDMRLEELRKYDGSDSSGRVLVAVNGKIFDVTRGKRFYGPGGPYSSLAGHDASRALAMFQTDLVKEEHDDLSDLNSMQMESVKEWEAQLAEKYDCVGKLLRPGEEATNYSEDEEWEQKEEDTEVRKNN